MPVNVKQIILKDDVKEVKKSTWSPGASRPLSTADSRLFQPLKSFNVLKATFSGPGLEIKHHTLPRWTNMQQYALSVL